MKKERDMNKFIFAKKSSSKICFILVLIFLLNSIILISAENLKPGTHVRLIPNNGGEAVEGTIQSSRLKDGGYVIHDLNGRPLDINGRVMGSFIGQDVSIPDSQIQIITNDERLTKLSGMIDSLPKNLVSDEKKVELKNSLEQWKKLADSNEINLAEMQIQGISGTVEATNILKAYFDTNIFQGLGSEILFKQLTNNLDFLNFFIAETSRKLGGVDKLIEKYPAFRYLQNPDILTDINNPEQMDIIKKQNEIARQFANGNELIIKDDTGIELYKDKNGNLVVASEGESVPYDYSLDSKIFVNSETGEGYAVYKNHYGKISYGKLIGYETSDGKQKKAVYVDENGEYWEMNFKDAKWQQTSITEQINENPEKPKIIRNDLEKKSYILENNNRNIEIRSADISCSASSQVAGYFDENGKLKVVGENGVNLDIIIDRDDPSNAYVQDENGIWREIVIIGDTKIPSKPIVYIGENGEYCVRGVKTRPNGKTEWDWRKYDSKYTIMDANKKTNKITDWATGNYIEWDSKTNQPVLRDKKGNEIFAGFGAGTYDINEDISEDLPRVELGERIGRGGVAEVYEGELEGVGRVAIRIPNSMGIPFSSISPQDYKELTENLNKEFETATIASKELDGEIKVPKIYGKVIITKDGKEIKAGQGDKAVNVEGLAMEYVPGFDFNSIPTDKNDLKKVTKKTYQKAVDLVAELVEKGYSMGSLKIRITPDGGVVLADLGAVEKVSLTSEQRVADFKRMISQMNENLFGVIEDIKGSSVIDIAYLTKKSGQISASATCSPGCTPECTPVNCPAGTKPGIAYGRNIRWYWSNELGSQNIEGVPTLVQTGERVLSQEEIMNLLENNRKAVSDFRMKNSIENKIGLFEAKKQVEEELKKRLGEKEREMLERQLIDINAEIEKLTKAGVTLEKLQEQLKSIKIDENALQKYNQAVFKYIQSREAEWKQLAEVIGAKVGLEPKDAYQSGSLKVIDRFNQFDPSISTPRAMDEYFDRIFIQGIMDNKYSNEINAVNRAIEMLFAEGKPNPKDSEILEKLKKMGYEPEQFWIDKYRQNKMQEVFGNVNKNIAGPGEYEMELAKSRVILQDYKDNKLLWDLLLTKREQEVIDLMFSKGMNPEEIAKQLGITDTAVSEHKISALNKLIKENANSELENLIRKSRELRQDVDKVKNAINELLRNGKLTDKRAKMLRAYFGIGETASEDIKEIAGRAGYSAERTNTVSDFITALQKLQEEIGKNKISDADMAQAFLTIQKINNAVYDESYAKAYQKLTSLAKTRLQDPNMFSVLPDGRYVTKSEFELAKGIEVKLIADKTGSNLIGFVSKGIEVKFPLPVPKIRLLPGI